jgi:quercetin dioxygenase-like cupin family protein
MNDTVARSTSSITRRAVVGGASAMAVAVGLGQRLGPRAASAQEATPTSDPIGIDSILLGAGVPPSAPETELLLLRTTMAPGGVLPPHIHRGPFVIAVESGTWGYTPQQGSVKVTRAAADGSFSPAEEAMLDEELILTQGDFLFIEDASQDWMRNAGEDELVLYISALNPVGQDFGTLVSELDTGTPTT